ncbi:MAG: universal stress protein [Anaerolineales bacterium]|jgi:nucleotide-binding universal stress UspA family protein
MYKTILVPLDGSKRAEAILPHVEELAQRYKARVVFTRIVEPPPLVIPPGQPDVTIYKSELEQRTEEAELYLKGIQGEFEEKGIDARRDLGKGPVVEAIVNAAMRHDADLIALASHGNSGLAQVFYGSVAAGILQRVDRPLLLIRSISGA